MGKLRKAVVVLVLIVLVVLALRSMLQRTPEYLLRLLDWLKTPAFTRCQFLTE